MANSRRRIAAFALILITACAPTATPPTAAPIATATRAATATLRAILAPTPANSLRALASNRNLLIGAAVMPEYIRREPIYAQTLAREFSALTAENHFKFGPLRPTQTTFKFDEADYLVEFAQSNGMRIRGHTLVWHNSLPDWLTKGNFSRDALSKILNEHIATVAGRYRGRIYAWDVVNEAIAEDGSLRDTIWRRGLGNDYLDQVFRWTQEADPNAKLIYNDFGGEGLGRKSDAIFNLVKGMKERGIPIDGVGLQMHIRVDEAPAKLQELDANIKRLSALNLDVHITELDVRVTLPATDASLAKQAQVYSQIAQTCIANANCKMFVMWGFTDKHSWIPQFFPGFGAGLVFDDAYQPKAAYIALRDALAGK
ncbi:MAG: endo-1,4-beta-xylanase [Chloroflexi bacterium]|nr:endo-1,4-beta-xylanase [Chloroflexota bacterium]